jgi:hypothetical protein
MNKEKGAFHFHILLVHIIQSLESHLTVTREQRIKLSSFDETRKHISNSVEVTSIQLKNFNELEYILTSYEVTSSAFLRCVVGN